MEHYLIVLKSGYAARLITDKTGIKAIQALVGDPSQQDRIWLGGQDADLAIRISEIAAIIRSNSKPEKE